MKKMRAKLIFAHNSSQLVATKKSWIFAHNSLQLGTVVPTVVSGLTTMTRRLSGLYFLIVNKTADGEWGHSTRRNMLEPVRQEAVTRQGFVLTDFQSLLDCQ
jgi:hypothetical protein